MMTPTFAFSTMTVSLNTGLDIKNITAELRVLTRESAVINGSLSATMIGSTGSLTTIEYEPGVVEDLKQAIERVAPESGIYEHEQAWHDGNGHSHVQAALMGPSLTVPIRHGDLVLGTWQQVVAINHDNRPRNRRIEVTLAGMTA